MDVEEFSILFTFLFGHTIYADFYTKIVSLNYDHDQAHLACTNSTYITIDTVTVLQNDTHSCKMDDECTLNEDDKNQIKGSCGKSNSCSIDLSLKTPCLKSIGFISLTFTCTFDAFSSYEITEHKDYNCNFEKDLCSWRNDGDTKWKRITAREHDKIKSDHTTGEGYGKFIYIEGEENNLAYLVIDTVFSTTGRKCLSIWYYRSHSSDNTIVIYINDQPTHVETKKVNEWTKAEVQISTKGIFLVMIVGLLDSKQSVIAIDDIEFFDGQCSATFHSICNFEQNCDLNSEAEEFAIVSGHAATSNSIKGAPTYDHTLGTKNGHYIRTDSYFPGKKAYWKIRPNYVTPSFCLSFWFYTFGDNIESLKVNHGSESLSVDIRQKYAWYKQSIHVRGSEITFIVTYLKMVNATIRGIALDDISIINGTCSETFSESCLQIDNAFTIHQCTRNNLIKNSFIIEFENDQQTLRGTECEDEKREIEKQIGYQCSTKENGSCTLTPLEILAGMNLMDGCNVNKRQTFLLINYMCTNNSENETQSSQAYTGIIIGVILGIGFITCLAVLGVLIFRRMIGPRNTKQTGNLQNNNNKDQSVPVPLDANHVANKDSYMDLMQTSNDAEYARIDDGTFNKNDEQVNAYLYLEPITKGLNESKCPTIIEKSNKGTIESHTQQRNGAAVDCNNYSEIPSNTHYAILDPDQTGFYRMNVKERDNTEGRNTAPTLPNKNDQFPTEMNILSSSGSSNGNFAVIGHNKGSFEHSLPVKSEYYLDANNKGGSNKSHVCDLSSNGNFAIIDPNETSFNRFEINSKHELAEPFETDGLPSESKSQPSTVLGSNGNYAILDPNETGFNRTATNHLSFPEYEFAKPVIEDENGLPYECKNNLSSIDPYGKIEPTEYDSTKCVRRRETDGNQYSHTVDSIYDTASRERKDESKEDMYDHFNGRRTDDDYDICVN